MPKATCSKYNCSLEANHDGWHVKKGARGKIIISWLDGQFKTPDGGNGTYHYVDDVPQEVVDILEEIEEGVNDGETSA